MIADADVNEVLKDAVRVCSPRRIPHALFEVGGRYRRNLWALGTDDDTAYYRSMTYQIIYSSDASIPMQSDDLEDLLEHARERNAQRGITGALVYVDGIFLQILEGDAATLKALMARISSDLRHEAVTVLQEGDVPSRRFSDWTMAYISATPEQVADWLSLPGTTPAPALFDGMRRDGSTVAHVARNVLSVLSADRADPASGLQGQA